MFTSAIAGEGKTTTCCNMAISMANELDKKIVLVDCDLRQSQVSRYLAIQQGRGLHEYLAETAGLDDIIKPTRLERLSVVTAGQPVENPSKLLTSPRMAELMAGEGVQIFGGNGYINEYPLGRLWRDAKLYEIGAGTSEIRRMLIGRELFSETQP